MTKEIILNDKDMLVMNLVNYFISEQNYTPVMVYGVKDEIWLENMQNDYKIIRIVSHYIHNDEQLNFDKFKLKRVIQKLKMKTFSMKLPVLNIYTDLGDNVNLDKDDNNTNLVINKLSDLNKNTLIEVFPNIVEKTKYKEEGMELFVKITDNINKANEKRNKKIEKIFSKKNPIITYTIIFICVIMFLLMTIDGGSTNTITLLKYGANLDVLTKNGQYFRLITSAFLHIGFFHLLFNMYALYIIGSQIESFYGKIKYIAIYLISALSGSLLSMAFSHNVVSAGASGAIFGLLGAMLHFGYKYRAYLGDVVKSQILPIIVLNLVLGFVLTGVDNAAHIGGLIAGILSSRAFGIDKDDTKNANHYIVLIIYLLFIGYLALIGV